MCRETLPPTCRGFTLVEVMFATMITGLLVVVAASVLNQTMKTWNFTKGRTEQFREARNTFERLTRHLSQAVLNSYWDYTDQNGNFRNSTNAKTFQPYRYIRQSELRFISGPGVAGTATSDPARPAHAVFFQAPLGYVDDTADFGGLPNLLNTWGYFIQYDSSASTRPGFFASLVHSPAVRHRFRLMELVQPSEKMDLYSLTGTNPGYKGHEWYTNALSATPGMTHPIAENIIALIILPKQSPDDVQISGGLAPNYLYDSTASGNQLHQLPPILQVTMVAVDEASFARLGNPDSAPALVNDAMFKTASQYESDMRTLIDTLEAEKLNYRVFTTDVVLKTAKWSANQGN